MRWTRVQGHRVRRAGHRRPGGPGPLLLTGLLTWVTACAGPPPPVEPGPRASALMLRHWDQVCRPARGEPAPLEIHELLDTLALAAARPRTALPSRHGDPVPLSGPGSQGHADRSATADTVEVMLRFLRDGALVEVLPWRSTTTPGGLADLGDALRSSLRPIPGFLTDTSIRVRLVRDDRVRAELPGVLECIPHMAHEPNRPPVGLPDSVVTVFGRSRPRPGEVVGTVRISLDAAGDIVAVDSVQGPGSAVRNIRGFVYDLRFDPALRNGVPVHGELVQSFRFSRRVSAPGGVPSVPGRDTVNSRPGATVGQAAVGGKRKPPRRRGSDGVVG